MAIIFITGAHGFIGRHLARHLATEGHSVAGIGHGVWSPDEARRWGISHWLNGEVSIGNLQLLLHLAGPPEAVFHLAGGSSVGVSIANPREDFARTVGSTADLLEWLRLETIKASLVTISSAAVYGSGRLGPIAESIPLKPYSPYGAHKAMMEALCQSYVDNYGLNITIARLFSVYGSGLKKQLLWDICNRLSAGSDILMLGGSGEELRDWANIGDVVCAFDLLRQHSANSLEIFNIGTGIATSVRDIANAMIGIWSGENAGRGPSLSFSGQCRPGDPFSLVADSGRLKNLGFTWQLPLSVGLNEYVRWFRKQAVYPRKPDEK